MPNRENVAALVRGSLPLSALEICKMSGDATGAASLGNSNPLATGPYVKRLTLTMEGLKTGGWCSQRLVRPDQRSNL